jgi:hypothetical protein
MAASISLVRIVVSESGVLVAQVDGELGKALAAFGCGTIIAIDQIFELGPADRLGCYRLAPALQWPDVLRQHASGAKIDCS